MKTSVEDYIIRKNESKNTLLEHGTSAEEGIALTTDLPMFQIMFGTACRCGETIGLTWSDIDKRKKRIERVYLNKQPWRIVNAKSSK